MLAPRPEPLPVTAARGGSPRAPLRPSQARAELATWKSQIVTILEHNNAIRSRRDRAPSRARLGSRSASTTRGICCRAAS